jgi:hypothetical protein
VIIFHLFFPARISTSELFLKNQGKDLKQSAKDVGDKTIRVKKLLQHERSGVYSADS